MEVDVEILDVTDEEREPSSSASTPSPPRRNPNTTHDRLLTLAHPSPRIASRLATTARKLATPPRQQKSYTTIPDQFFVLVKCRDEPHQLDLLAASSRRDGV